MIMAHDPTRSWPTGKGPDDTSIPGAAWLELLDGQAFPVVGAGTMVRDGNAWTPASSSNPLHVRAQALEQLIGALNATKETNPDAASASMLALLRGLIAIVGKEATLAQSIDKLNSILSRLEDKLDTAIFDSQGEPISAANRLPVEATLTGRLPALHATDPETGNPVPVQAVQDDAGNWVLGIVDRAPYAYDPVADATRVVLPTLVSGVYTRTNAQVAPSSSWSTDIIESGEAQRIRLMTFVSQRMHPNFLDLKLEWYADADGQWRIVREVTGEPAEGEIKFENIKPIQGNAGIGTATVKGPYFRFTFFNAHESAPYTINRLAIHKFLDG